MIDDSSPHAAAPAAAPAPRDHVELVMPTDPALWSLARLTVSAVAARIAFGVDEIEDLRLAIDELCTSCAAGSTPASRMRLVFETDATTLRVECATDELREAPDHETFDAALGGMTESELSLRILAELVDDFGVGQVESGVRRAFLEMRRQVAAI